jgi:hypothetical protein
LVVAGGGGNGAPLTNTVNSGGGSGAVTRALYNAQQLPDTLYVQVGLGGAAATSRKQKLGSFTTNQQYL